jgi:hypothetical protein
VAATLSAPSLPLERVRGLYVARGPAEAAAAVRWLCDAFTAEAPRVRAAINALHAEGRIAESQALEAAGRAAQDELHAAIAEMGALLGRERDQSRRDAAVRGLGRTWGSLPQPLVDLINRYTDVIVHRGPLHERRDAHGRIVGVSAPELRARRVPRRIQTAATVAPPPARCTAPTRPRERRERRHVARRTSSADGPDGAGDEAEPAPAPAGAGA